MTHNVLDRLTIVIVHHNHLLLDLRESWGHSSVGKWCNLVDGQLSASPEFVPESLRAVDLFVDERLAVIRNLDDHFDLSWVREIIFCGSYSFLHPRKTRSKCLLRLLVARGSASITLVTLVTKLSLLLDFFDFFTIYWMVENQGRVHFHGVIWSITAVWADSCWILVYIWLVFIYIIVPQGWVRTKVRCCLISLWLCFFTLMIWDLRLLVIVFLSYWSWSSTTDSTYPCAHVTAIRCRKLKPRGCRQRCNRLLYVIDRFSLLSHMLLEPLAETDSFWMAEGFDCR